MKRRLRAREQLLELRAPLRERNLAQIIVAQREHVPCDVRRWRLLGEQLHARRGRMNAQQQRLEVETIRASDDDLTVEHATLGKRIEQRRDEFREVTIHRLL